MSPNIHTPERLEGESRKDYQARRKASKAAVRAMLRGTPTDQIAGRTRMPGRNHIATAASQNPKFPKERRHKRKDLIKPTWPATPDQHKQGRPLILMHPTSHMSKAWRHLEDVRAMPKHALDRFALLHPV